MSSFCPQMLELAPNIEHWDTLSWTKPLLIWFLPSRSWKVAVESVGAVDRIRIQTNWTKCSGAGIQNSGHNRKRWKQGERRPDPDFLARSPLGTAIARDAIRENAEQLAKENQIEIEFIRSRKSGRKEDRVQEILQQRGEEPGLVCILSAMEPCGTYQPWHNKKNHKTYLIWPSQHLDFSDLSPTKSNSHFLESA